MARATGPAADGGGPAPPEPSWVIPPTPVDAASRGVVLGTVGPGETWRFEAEGRWLDRFIPCGPDGYKSFLWDVLDVRPRFPGANWFCLVGMIEGLPGSEFRIGHGGEHTFAQGGRLIAFANDDLARRGGKSGAVTVRGARLRQALNPADPMCTPGRFKGLMGAWRALQDVLDRSATVGVVAFLVLAVCFAVAGLQQGRDLIQSVAEDGYPDVLADSQGAGAPALQAFGGLAWRQVAFCLSLLLLAVQAWLWPRMIINTNCGLDREAWGPGRRLLEWGPRLLGGAPFLAVGYALVANSQPNALLIGVLVLISAGFFVVVIFRQDFARRLDASLTARAARRGRARRPVTARGLGKVWVLFSAALGFVLMVVFTIWPVGPARFFGAPAVVFLGVGLMIPWVTLAVQQGRLFQIPVVGLFLLLAALFSLSAALDNHAVGRRALGHQARRPVEARLSLDQAYALWRDRQPPGQKLMVLVAAEGGASRAGFWTGEALSALHEQTGGRLARSLFAISSVSGGSVGAVGYDVVLQDNPALPAKDLRPELERLTGADALSPVVGGLLFPDLLYRFAPLPFLPDRAEALERSWEQAWNDRPHVQRPTTVSLDQAFLSLQPRPDQPWRPILIINGASEESGRRILTSTVALPASIDGHDFHELVGRDVAISTAIHNGARFPWISPAGTLTGDGHAQGHVIDGGYFDAVGVEAIRELAQAIHDGPGRGDDIRFVFVVVAYGGPGASGPAAPPAWSLEPTPPPTTGPPSAAPRTDPIAAKWSLNEILAPLRGFFSSRAGHGEHMARELIATARSDDLGPASVYASVLLCEPDQFRNPMDWALSKRAQNHMRRAAHAEADGRMLCPRAATEIQRLAALINHYQPPP